MSDQTTTATSTSPAGVDGGRRGDRRWGVLQAPIAAARDACARGDGHALAAAIRDVLPLCPEALAIDLVGTLELSMRDMELATIRWTHLSKLLASSARRSGRGDSSIASAASTAVSAATAAA